MPDVITGDVIDRAKVRALLEIESDPALSIYFPTQQAVVEPEENSLRLKDALKLAHERLGARGLKKVEIEEFLHPLRRLLDDVSFWRHQAAGLALFRTATELRSLKLPYPVDEQVVVNDEFYIKPLLPALSTAGFFYILALSQNRIRLFRASRYGISEVDLSGLDLPRSLAEALRYDDFERPDLHTHSRRPALAGGGKEAAIFHGRGADEDERKDEIRRFFNEVDRGLRPLLGASRAPLILAGVEFLRPIYREASEYRYIVPRGIDGNPDDLHPQELLERAAPIIDEHFAAALDKAREHYGDALARGLASDDAREIVIAAFDGRIDSLFASMQDELWGRVDYEQRTVVITGSPDDGSVDLTDVAARRTLLASGHVYVVDRSQVPSGKELAAVFRY